MLLDADVQAGIVVDRTGALRGMVLTSHAVAAKMREGEHAIAAAAARRRRSAPRTPRRSRPSPTGGRGARPGCRPAPRSSTWLGREPPRRHRLADRPAPRADGAPARRRVRHLARPRDLGGPPARRSTARSPRSRASCTRSRAWRRSPCSCPIFGFSLLTALIPLTTYTLLILFRNIVAGFQCGPARGPRGGRRDGLHAARSGCCAWSCPLAVPLMIAGIRLARVTLDRPRDGRLDPRRPASAGSGSSSPRGCRRSSRPSTCWAPSLSVLLAFTADFLFVRLERRHHAVGAGTRRAGGGDMDESSPGSRDPAQLAGRDRDPVPARSSTWRSRASSILLATLIALPIGLYIGHTNRGASLAINLANIGRAIPSYAMMVIPCPDLRSRRSSDDPALGLMFLPIFLAMTFLAIPPLLVTTYAGPPRGRSRPASRRAAGMGLRERQILRPDRAPARVARSSSAASGPRPSRSSRRRRSGRSSGRRSRPVHLRRADAGRRGHRSIYRRRDPRGGARDRRRPVLAWVQRRRRDARADRTMATRPGLQGTGRRPRLPQGDAPDRRTGRGAATL